MTQSFLQAPMIGDAGFVQPQQYGDTVASNTQAFQQDMTRYYSQVIEQENARAVEKDALTTKILNFLGKEGSQLVASEVNRRETDRQHDEWYRYNTGRTQKDTKDYLALNKEEQEGLTAKGLIINLQNPGMFDDAYFAEARKRVDNGEMSEEVYTTLKNLADNQDPGKVTREMLREGVRLYPKWIEIARRNGLKVRICNDDGCEFKTWEQVNKPGEAGYLTETKAWMEGANRVFLRPYQGTAEDGWTDPRQIKRILIPAIHKFRVDEQVKEGQEIAEVNRRAQKSKDYQSAVSAIVSIGGQTTDTSKANSMRAVELTNWAKSDGMRYGGGAAAIEWLKNEVLTRGQRGDLSTEEIAAFRGALQGKFRGNDGNLHSLGTTFENGVEKPGYWKSIQGLETALTLAEKRNLNTQEQIRANDRTNQRVIALDAIDKISQENGGVPPDDETMMQLIKGTHSRSAEFGLEPWKPSWGHQGWVNFVSQHSPSEALSETKKVIANAYMSRSGGYLPDDSFIKGMTAQDYGYYKQFVGNPYAPSTEVAEKFIKGRATTYYQSSGDINKGDAQRITESNLMNVWSTSVQGDIEDGITNKNDILKNAQKAVVDALGNPDKPGVAVAPTDAYGLVTHDFGDVTQTTLNRKNALVEDRKAIKKYGNAYITQAILPGTPLKIREQLLYDGKRNNVSPEVQNYYQYLAKASSPPGSRTPLNWWAIANAQYQLLRIEAGLSNDQSKNMTTDGQIKEHVTITPPVRSWKGIDTTGQLHKILNPHNTNAMTLALVNDTTVEGEKPAPWLVENLKLAEAEANGGYNAFTFGARGGDIFGEGFQDSSKVDRPYSGDLTATYVQPISELSIGQIQTLQEEGIIDKVGIYGFDQDKLKKALQGSGIVPEAIFDQSIQEQLILGYQRTTVNNNSKGTIGEDISWLELLTPVDEYVALEQNMPWANRRENLIPALHGVALEALRQSSTTA